jgi:hypothetical protein
MGLKAANRIRETSLHLATFYSIIDVSKLYPCSRRARSKLYVTLAHIHSAANYYVVL